MTRTRTPLTARLQPTLLSLLMALLAFAPACAPREAIPAQAPGRLADTGLYADFATRTLAADVLPFTPQYPLWTDGASKQRWIALPPGSAIDAADVDAFVFPVGTRFWKEFAFGRAVETRFMQRRADGSWLYATYVWTPDGSDAVLAPDRGAPRVCATADGQSHDVPSVADCRLCHEGGRSPVLGFSALQLSPDRDPLAPHASPSGSGDVDLHSLAARGLLRNLPAPWSSTPPRIAARTERERAALGYLHGNCGGCHNGAGPLQRLGLRLDYPLDPLARALPAPAITTTVDVPSHFTRDEAATRIVPGAPERSVLTRRLAARDALTQMPPFGRHLVDRTALELIEDWVCTDLASTSATGTLARSTKTKEH